MPLPTAAFLDGCNGTAKAPCTSLGSKSSGARFGSTNRRGNVAAINGAPWSGAAANSSSTNASSARRMRSNETSVLKLSG